MNPQPATGNGLNDTEPTKLIAVLLYPDGRVKFDIDDGVSAVEIFGVAEMLRQYGIDEMETDEPEDAD